MFLDKAPDVESFFHALASSPALALDLEADSLYSYQEKVCLVQISTTSANAILDPLTAREGMPALGPLLADRRIQKVFHGANYDVRLLKKDLGVAVHNIADTMVAAQLTGREQVGLGALLAAEFGLTLDKKYQRANWARRPLEELQLQYAVLDSAYLLPLWEKLRADLERLGRLSWAEEEFLLLEEMEPAPPREPSCFDVKGAGLLSPRELAILHELVLVRDQAARACDCPPFKVLPNQALLQWARDPPQRREQITRTPAANRGMLRRLAPDLMAAVQRGQALPADSCPHRPKGHFVPLTAEQKERFARLKQARQEVAEQLQLSPGLLVNSDTLERASSLPRSEALQLLESGLKRWQREVLGARLRAAMLP